LLAVRGYGEAEFWLSGGKVILIFLLFGFTFVTMVGGNPSGHAYGFYHWQNPGAFKEYVNTGALGRFEGFLACLWNAGFAVVGPEYISMVAAEAQRPRVFIKTAFKTIYYRFALFFFGSALCVGIVLRSNDPTLTRLRSGGAEGSEGSTAAASPYVIAMGNMGIDVLPSIVNALMLTSIYSAGNTYTYCATRTLYGLALDGRAPRFLRKTWSNGVPFYCFCVVMLFPCLSFLQVGESSAVVIDWLVSLITAGGLIDFMVMSLTFIFFYRACQAQGIDRSKLPYYGRFQPYGAYIALAFQTIMVFVYGYETFRPWNVESFFRNYTMQILAPILFIGWKVIKKTRFIRPHECDLTWEAPGIDRYEAQFTEPAPGFWAEMLSLVGIKLKSKKRALAAGE
jgi:amino acid transporter